MTTVSCTNLYKSYGAKTAVKDLSFSADPGEILGLIGPNGAGKSTTIKIILDFLKPDSGEVKVFGHPMNEAIKNQNGIVIRVVREEDELNPFPHDFKILNNDSMEELYSKVKAFVEIYKIFDDE